jgi:hypothetical protein
MPPKILFRSRSTWAVPGSGSDFRSSEFQARAGVPSGFWIGDFGFTISEINQPLRSNIFERCRLLFLPQASRSAESSRRTTAGTKQARIYRSARQDFKSEAEREAIKPFNRMDCGSLTVGTDSGGGCVFGWGSQPQAGAGCRTAMAETDLRAVFFFDSALRRLPSRGSRRILCPGFRA